MADALALYSGGGTSHAPTRSIYRDWYDRMAAQAMGHSKIEQAGIHMIEAAQVIRQGGESILMGGLLGLLHVELKNGLDVHMGNGNVPVDGVVGAIGLGGAVAAAGHPQGIATDLRNIGASGATIYSFRKTLELLGEKKLAKGQSIGGTLGPKSGPKTAGAVAHGDDEVAPGDDPIVSFARSM